MRKLVSAVAVLLVLGCSIAAVAQGKKGKGAYIRLDPAEVKLGDIPLDKLSDSHGKVEIKVLNEGSSPLLLNRVEGCCGTEIKEYAKTPILPGKEAIIRVEFRIEPKPQAIRRVVTIHSNAVNSKELTCPITGSVVLPKKAGRIEF